ncbi:MAG: cbb3-type cytochrome c oxidase subunit 3 [Vicinamibacteraceae bacterium]
MYTDILRSIAGIEVFPVLSLVVFVSFFTAVLVWVARLDPQRVASLSALPLDATDEPRGRGVARVGEAEGRR